MTPPAVPDGRPGSDGPPIDGSIDAPIDGQPIDGSIDAPIDGPPAVKKFDVAFGNKFRIAWNFAGNGFIGFVAIANTSAKPLALSKLSVVSVSDDNTGITTSFRIESPSELPLAPGEAAGLLGGQATALIVEGGLMTEMRNDESLMFALDFPNFSAAFSGKTVHIEAKLAIDDGEITLPLEVAFVESQITVIDTAVRLSARQVVPN